MFFGVRNMLSCDQNTVHFHSYDFFACYYTSLFLIPLAKERDHGCRFNTLSNNCFYCQKIEICRKQVFS